MEITINNVQTEVEPETNLEAIVVNQLGDKLSGTAVALNGSVVPKAQWASTPIQQNDEVLIIKATQGG